MAAQRSLLTLDELVQGRFGEWLRLCSARGVAVLVYETRRTLERQLELYRRGRELPGRVVTNAQPGDSWHNYGRAVDAAPLELAAGGEHKGVDWSPFRTPSGRRRWERGEHDLELLDRPWRVMVDAADVVGIGWAGRWRGSLLEYVHFQITDGLDRRALRTTIADELERLVT